MRRNTELKVRTDPNWSTSGRGDYLSRTLKPADPKFVSDTDFDDRFDDNVVRTPQMALGGAVIVTSPLVSGSTTLANGEQTIFSITVKTPASGVLKNMTLIDMSLYAGSIADTNQLPGGASVNEANFQVIGPWNDLAATNNIYTVIKLYVRNISNGSTLLTLRLRVRTQASRNTSSPVGIG